MANNIFNRCKEACQEKMAVSWAAVIGVVSIGVLLYLILSVPSHWVLG